MSAYVVRRILLFIPALVGASMLIFVLMRIVPGDIAEILVYQTGSETSGVQQKQIQRIRQELGLDQPVMIQYLSWMGGAVRGDFGKSYTQRRPVWDILRERFPRSMELALLTLAIALVWAIPLGVVCGLSPTMNAAFNPLIQLFKPVSPLAWLPIVTMVVSAVYVSDNPIFEKSFLNSAITVTLCSLWPTLINTAVGVASIDKDLINVGRVLRLPCHTKVVKIVLPSSLPLIFTGMRLSLGVGWMVLIAAEMLAQNPGLGQFVWDEFQNGSSQSLAKIMVAVLTIGLIGFMLDRLMFTLQRAFTYSANL